MTNFSYFLVFTVLYSLISWAETEPVPFVAYDQARVLFRETLENSNYKLALSPYLKKQNIWQAEKFLRLKGTLYRQTHELPKGLDEQEIFEFYRDQLPENQQALFTCERRDCGDSNNWANDHFGIKQLYGLEQYQFYGVYQVAEQWFYTIYTVKRGNGKIYTQIESLSVRH